MKKALIVDPFSGISGDMFMGALVDAGAPFDKLRETLLAIPVLSGLEVAKESVTRGVFAATRIKVACPEEKAHRGVSGIRDIIAKADLSERVKKGAVKTFKRLAEAEAKVHGSDVDAVHFHEVGALDAIFDIVGAHLALELLGNPVTYCTTLVLGTGTTQSAHGEIPVPAPATVELLSGHRIVFSDRDEELVTPTGAAIVASCFAPIDRSKAVTPARVGYGAGSRERRGMPNVLRAIVGSVEAPGGHVCIVTSTIDDMNPELYGEVMDKLFGIGALDVYYNAVMMKKNRPGLEITVITEERDIYLITDFLLGETTTLGVRVNREERVELERHKDTVETPYGTVDVKIAERPGGRRTMSPEYESCKAAAKSADVGLLEVYEAARRAWDEKHSE
jgi:uncharacterized protein (TIGR00299 family) protein